MVVGVLPGRFFVSPEKPAEGDLGRQNGEEKGERPVSQVVKPGGVYNEGD